MFKTLYPKERDLTHQDNAVGLDLIGPEAIRDHGSILSEQLLQLHDGEGACQVLHMEDPAGRVSSRGWSTTLHCGVRMCVCEDVCV